MLSLSPAKLLVILVIALIVLGPEKLPGVARQLGAAWGDVRRWRVRLEEEVRGVFPDLPPPHQVAQAVRSPLAFLDRLADEHERGQSDDSGSERAGADGAGLKGGASPGVPPADGGGAPTTPTALSSAERPELAAGAGGGAGGAPASGRGNGQRAAPGAAGGPAGGGALVDDPSMN